MSDGQQSDPSGGLVKRCQESEPALISVICSFLLSLSEVKYHWLKKGERRENCQSIKFDEELLRTHGVGNRTFLQLKISRPYLYERKS